MRTPYHSSTQPAGNLRDDRKTELREGREPLREGGIGKAADPMAYLVV